MNAPCRLEIHSMLTKQIFQGIEPVFKLSDELGFHLGKAGVEYYDRAYVACVKFEMCKDVNTICVNIDGLPKFFPAENFVFAAMDKNQVVLAHECMVEISRLLRAIWLEFQPILGKLQKAVEVHDIDPPALLQAYEEVAKLITRFGLARELEQIIDIQRLATLQKSTLILESFVASI